MVAKNVIYFPNGRELEICAILLASKMHKLLCTWQFIHFVVLEAEYDKVH